ncbi:diaminopropionate ammonia-lyase [Pseudomonas sp. BN415]|uniref:diaminopropionate ammonia-lyase n=1 Tax=Pseudomonas sp. BN415 TaxID=2567889 RepID=UPI002456E734|nr:diaminopropionate ammonia-lyase [Pseudomonas sp. BN415]MDH4582626.1 diaminopropionate ammonia-lyase [Pseudomonas sp. BN415]
MRLYMNVTQTPAASSAPDAFSPVALDSVYTNLALIDYQETPLYELRGLARRLGVSNILVKDEGQRSSLRSFKALGGAHAVVRLVLQEVGKRLGCSLQPSDLMREDVRAVARTLTLCCATDGNHGRSVAAAARVVGCRSVIFIHEGVSESRGQAIGDQGAEVIRVTGNYDDSVEHASRMAEENGWYVVSDTSWPGYEAIPTWVMQGYLVMANEALNQATALGKPVTHVFLQAGVGGYAAAITAYLVNALGEQAPRVVVVEPENAACLYASAVKRECTRIEARDSTIMGMLECYEPSLVAWRILSEHAAAFMTISDEAGLHGMARMAYPLSGDPVICGGESGAAGLAGLQSAANSDMARQSVGLDENSVVLLFNTEGATDEVLYESLLLKAKALL